jgi:5-methylcytosine-specific restriction endonuclease McrA
MGAGPKVMDTQVRVRRQKLCPDCGARLIPLGDHDLCRKCNHMEDAVDVHERTYAEIAKELEDNVRPTVISRDKGRCVLCGMPAAHVHHIVFRSQFGKDTLEECWDVDNLVCLCLDCHNMAHGPEAEWVREKCQNHIKAFWNETHAQRLQEIAGTTDTMAILALAVVERAILDYREPAKALMERVCWECEKTSVCWENVWKAVPTGEGENREAAKRSRRRCAAGTYRGYLEAWFRGDVPAKNEPHREWARAEVWCGAAKMESGPIGLLEAVKGEVSVGAVS